MKTVEISVTLLPKLVAKTAGHLNIKTKMASEILSDNIHYAANHNACIKVVFMLRWPAFPTASLGSSVTDISKVFINCTDITLRSLR